MKLNLGCGRNPIDGWVNCDIMDGPGVDRVFDLEKPPYPFETDSADNFHMSHVLEHIRGDLNMMEELHRIAKPGAEIALRCPYGSHDSAFEDPTHVKILFENSFMYYGQSAYCRADYGYRGDWERTHLILSIPETFRHLKDDSKMSQVKLMRNVCREITCIMKAVKPIRPPEQARSSTAIEWEYHD